MKMIKDLKIVIAMIVGMGLGAFAVGLVNEIHLLFPSFIREPTHPEYMLPFGLALIVSGDLIFRYLEKKEAEK